jgi:hypothetical protein
MGILPMIGGTREQMTSIRTPLVSSHRRHGQDARARWTLLILFICCSATSAQPIPTLKSASPDVLQLGHSTTLTLTGENISAASQVLLTSPAGLSATIKAAPPTTKPASQITLEIATAADAPRGLRELRLVTPNGVTKPILIAVDDLTPVLEKEPNNSLGEAQPITLPAVISGKIQVDLDIDCFAFDARKGQRLIFDVRAARDGSKLDASLFVLDHAGRRVVHDEDTNGLDPLIDFTVPADGRYTLRIQDLQYKGGGDFGYRIRAGELPRADNVFSPPPAPADVPQVSEAAGRAASAALSPPILISGCISKPGESDTFTFKPTAPGPIVLEIAAARFGSRLDPLLTLADEKGNVLQRNDDAAGADARITFTAEKDKTYKAIVRDLTDHGGDAYNYRLSIAPPREARPDFDVTLRGESEIRLNRGGRTMLRADVTRKGAFKSDVTVALFPLPPGVTCKPLVVPATQPSSGVFTLTAAPDAPTGFHPLTVTATAAVGDEIMNKTVAARPNGETPQVYLSIHDAAPIQVTRIGPSTDGDKDSRAQKIAALEKTLNTPTPQLAEAQARWEKTFEPARAWEVVDVLEAKASSSIQVLKQPDGSIQPTGRVPSVDKYTVVARVASANVRAIRLEALNDTSVGPGPGRAPNGNFVLSTFKVAVLPDGSKDAGAGKPIELASATADFNQPGFDVADTIAGKPDGGWAVASEFGKTHVATYALKSPVVNGNTTLAFTLDHASKFTQHVIGRFRLLVTATDKPDDALKIPSPLLAVLKTPAEKRAKEQQDALAAFYRSIAPELAKTRDELAALKSSGAPFPPVVPAGGQAKLDVLVTRSPNFAGEITLTLDGFSTGPDEKGGFPAPFTKNFDFTPVTLKPTQSAAVLELKAKPTAEKGTRDAILKAETTVNGARYTIYSQTFPVTVK